MALRYHKAAQDGLLEILKEATKRDCNIKDEDGMTPTLWAANNGHLEALRLLVGKGGNVEKTNYHFGHTALHVAALQGHLHCVTFLVNFDANLFALDNDFHIPLQVATDPEIIDFLDKAATSQSLNNKKDVKAKKEKSLKEAERRRKKYEEKIKKVQDIKKKKDITITKETVAQLHTEIPTITAVEVNPQKFTDIVGGTLSKKPVLGMKKIIDQKFKVEDKKFKGSQKAKKDAQIIYAGSIDNVNFSKRGKVPQFLDESHIQSSMFDRPGFGSVAFRKRANLAGTLSGTHEAINEQEEEEEVGSENSIGSAGSLANRHRNPWISDEISDDDLTIGNSKGTPMGRFMLSAGVEEYVPQLMAQQVDLDAILMLSENDLIQLGIPLGPRRKLLNAVENRKSALKSPGLLIDSKL